VGTTAVFIDAGWEAAHAALSEEAFAAIWEEGRAMTQEQAIEYALEERIL